MDSLYVGVFFWSIFLTAPYLFHSFFFGYQLDSNMKKLINTIVLTSLTGAHNHA